MQGGVSIHLFDLQTRYLHTADNVRKEGHHVVIAHCHVGNDLLESNLLRGVVLVFLPSAVELQSQLGDFALQLRTISHLRRRKEITRVNGIARVRV